MGAALQCSRSALLGSSGIAGLTRSLLCLSVPPAPQGARAVAVFSLEDAAWISAAGAGGAAIIGTAILWPLMKKRVAAFDAAQSSLPTKDADGNGRFAEVEEDGFQKRVDDKLKALCTEVDPNDKSVGAYFCRFRCARVFDVACGAASESLMGMGQCSASGFAQLSNWHCKPVSRRHACLCELPETQAPPTHASAVLRCAVLCRNAALKGMTHDIHADVEEDPKVIAMAEAAERFDPRTEEVFKVLQVISACAMMFTHGANGEPQSLLCRMTCWLAGPHLWWSGQWLAV